MRLQRCAALGLVLLLSACASDEGPGRFRVVFDFEGDDRPSPDDGLFAWGKVEFRPPNQTGGTQLAETGRPEPLTNQLSLAFSDVPNGTNRVVVIELRDSDTDDYRVLWFGESAPFEIAAGRSVDVEVPLAPRRTPERPADDPAVADGSVEIAHMDGVGGVVPEHVVDLYIRATDADWVRVANDIDLTANVQEREVEALPLAPDGERRLWSGWNMNEGVCDGDCLDGPRVVYVVLGNTAGYRTTPRSARVTLDSSPPQVRASLDRLLVNAEQTLRLDLNSSEPLDLDHEKAELRIDGPGTEGPIFETIVQRGLVYSSIVRANVFADGVYTVSGTVVDALGNDGPLSFGEGGEVITEQSFEVDTTPPELGPLTSVVVSRDTVRDGETVEVSFEVADCDGDISECLDLEQTTVSLSGIEMAHVSGTTWTHTASRATDGSAARRLQILLVDPAGNRNPYVLGRTVVFDFEAPRLNCTLTPLLAGAGEQMTLQVVTDEPVQPSTLTVGFGGRDTSITAVEIGDDAGSDEPRSRFDFEIVPAEPLVDLEFAGDVTATDLAGNRGRCSGDIAGGFDTIPPNPIQPVEVGERVYKDGEPISMFVFVDPDERLVQPPSLELDGRPFEATEAQSVRGRWTLRYVADEDVDESGQYPLLLRLEDTAGNSVAVDLGLVTLDFDAPSVDCTVAPASAAAGDTVRVILGFDEPLAGGIPTVTLTDSESFQVQPARADTEGTTFVYRLIPEPGVTIPRYRVSVEANDRVGNELNAPDLCGGSVDTEPPVPELVQPLLDRDFRHGEEIRVVFDLKEDETLGRNIPALSLDDRPFAVDTEASDDTHWELVLIVDDDENASGTFPLVLQIEDAAGNRAATDLGLVTPGLRPTPWQL